MNRNPNRGGIAQYIREDIPSRQISFKNDDEDIAHFCWNQPLKEKMVHVHITLTCSS